MLGGFSFLKMAGPSEAILKGLKSFIVPGEHAAASGAASAGKSLLHALPGTVARTTAGGVGGGVLGGMAAEGMQGKSLKQMFTEAGGADPNVPGLYHTPQVGGYSAPFYAPAAAVGATSMLRPGVLPKMQQAARSGFNAIEGGVVSGQMLPEGTPGSTVIPGTNIPVNVWGATAGAALGGNKHLQAIMNRPMTGAFTGDVLGRAAGSYLDPEHANQWARYGTAAGGLYGLSTNPAARAKALGQPVGRLGSHYEAPMQLAEQFGRGMMGPYRALGNFATMGRMPAQELPQTAAQALARRAGNVVTGGSLGKGLYEVGNQAVQNKLNALENQLTDMRQRQTDAAYQDLLNKARPSGLTTLDPNQTAGGLAGGIGSHLFGKERLIAPDELVPRALEKGPLVPDGQGGWKLDPKISEGAQGPLIKDQYGNWQVDPKVFNNSMRPLGLTKIEPSRAAGGALGGPWGHLLGTERPMTKDEVVADTVDKGLERLQQKAPGLVKQKPDGTYGLDVMGLGLDGTKEFIEQKLLNPFLSMLGFDVANMTFGQKALTGVGLGLTAGGAALGLGGLLSGSGGLAATGAGAGLAGLGMTAAPFFMGGPLPTWMQHLPGTQQQPPAEPSVSRRYGLENSSPFDPVSAQARQDEFARQLRSQRELEEALAPWSTSQRASS